MNKTVLIGRLCKDNDTRVAQSGNGDMTIVRNSIAVDRKGKDAGTDFINIVAFGKTAEFMDKYFIKGQRIAICGHIQTGSYTNKDGAKVYTTDVIADEVEFVESKGTTSAPATQNVDSNGFMDIPDNIAEELPFS